MRSLAYIETIKSLTPIPGADKIEKAEVLDWEVVVQVGQFKVGDMVIYCEIDSILPELSCFEFLRPKKFRIKTIKLKGQVSQGIVFPLSILQEVNPSLNSFHKRQYKVGQDITNELGITKYDPEASLDNNEQEKKPWLERKLSFLKWKLFGIKPTKRGDFPTWLVPKTDETRVQKMGSTLYEVEGRPAYITEKLDGSSATFIYRKPVNWFAKLFNKEGIFQICSRNRIVYDSRKGDQPDHYLRMIALKYNIHEQLKKLNRNIAVQGESLGGKIQGNIYKLLEHELRVFSIFDIDTQEYTLYDELISLIKELELPMVPIVDNNAVIVNSAKYYVELSKGKSQLNPNTLREGIVIRVKDGHFSFKSISPSFLLKQE
jgi:RNA ligase